MIRKIKNILRKILRKDIRKQIGSIGSNVYIPSDTIISGGIIFNCMIM